MTDMSSLELSDDIASSEDEDVILASMETRSGLPQKSAVTSHTQASNKMMQSDSVVATVKMSGGVMRSGNLYESSGSEDEDIMKDVPDQLPDRSRTNDRSFSDMVSSGSIGSTNTVKSQKSSSICSQPDVIAGRKESGDVMIPNGKTDMTDSVANGSDINQSVSSSYKEARFNPFDRDLHIDEDHFENQSGFKSRKTPGRLKSASRTSDGADSSNPDSSTSDDITFADLGLSEDHFSQPEGYFGMSSTEELEMAIETCKELILLAPPNSDKHKNLVKKLIQLRLKLQELKVGPEPVEEGVKLMLDHFSVLSACLYMCCVFSSPGTKCQEGPEPVEEGVKLVVGHKFQLKTSTGTKHYCEKCNGVIWGLLHVWHRCAECGYNAHEKCMNQITRTCASVRVKEDPTYLLSICPDPGLSAQNYRCAECRGHISYKSGYSEPRVCDYSGNYYCELCHWNDTMLIPARVLHNWDFDEWKVCRASKQFLRLMETKAVIRIQDINPMLFSFVEELNDVKKLREELLIMKRYILICAVAMDSKLLLQLQSRQHFVESSDIYSMKDLIDVHRDALLPELAQVHSAWAQHIKTDCELCKAKGFICELCDEKEILFPFDNIAVVCSECSNVLHRHCFAKRGGLCPRCERRSKRKNN